jgi:uncharacterized membrane protein
MSETTGTPAIAAEPRRAPRWLKFGLIASLALNLLLIGLIAGGAWVHRRFDGTGSATVQAARYVRGLPGDRRSAIREAMRAEIDKMRGLRRDVRAERDAARAVLAATPFDKAAYAAAQQKLLEKELLLRQQGTHMLVETVGMLTPEERQGLAKVEARREQRWRRRSSRDDAPRREDPK